MNPLLRLNGPARRDPAIDSWMQAQPGELGAIAREWFEVMRRCGDDVRELLHDGFPTACVSDAAFAHVAIFKPHVNIAFFRGAELADPTDLLEGTGKMMRHVKLKPSVRVDAAALTKLINAAYLDVKVRLRAEANSYERPR